MKLAPYAAIVLVQFDTPKSNEEWSGIAARLLETIAERCGRLESAIIGHIKGLAAFPGNEYLRASVVSTGLPAEVESTLSGPVAELTMTINILVYGTSKNDLENILDDVLSESHGKWTRREKLECLSSLRP